MKLHLVVLSRSSRLLVAALVAVAFGVTPTFAADPKPAEPLKPKKLQQITNADKKAAAKRAADGGLKPGVAGVAAPTAAAGITALAAPIPGVTPAGINEGPGGVPHYFGPYANWAYSPLPSFPILSVTVTAPGSGYVAPIVTITDVYGTGTATASATLDAAGGIAGITVSASSGFHVPFVTITDDPAQCGVAVPCGAGATATASLDFGQPAGGMLKFVDTLPGLGPAGANNLGQYLPVGVPEQRSYPNLLIPGTFQVADYYEIAIVEYMEKMHSSLPATRTRGYVQLSTAPRGLNGECLQVPLYLPRVDPADPLVPVLMPDGSQACALDNPHYLGPVIVAQGRAHGVSAANGGEPRPVRIKFYNLLPSGAGGNLFLPVDETVPGSGLGPSVAGSLPGDKFTQNRATIHLHGNNTVWISDGNVHQWFTPADELTPYPKGVSVHNVPDMLDANGAPECDAVPAGKTSSGCMTFFYTNAQSARLQFYHDHAFGITRLNVYAGEAAGYVIQDAVEKDLIDGTNVSGVNPGLLKVLPDLGIPLVVQDRTWVDAETIFAQDPTWNWGTGPRDPLTGNITAGVTGDLWYPHVYLSAQNPWDLGGVNPFGRWMYGPWFNPPVPECVNGGPVGCIELGPVPNEYYQPVCDGLPDPVNATCTAPWEPPMRPGVPNPSIPGEGFMDTPVVNGTAYPVLNVEPKAYRFRVLNAANDRAFNFQLYLAMDKNSFVPGTGPADPGTATLPCDGVTPDPVTQLPVPPERCTEIKMVSVAGQPNQFADWPSGIPDPATAGPSWILIGTEGGFVPEPLEVPQQPVGWNLNATTFNFGTVNQHSLFLGSAERADVIVDFSAYAGKTLILYNDSPAPVPAAVLGYDYYTGNGDQVDAGGAPGTQPGYGPNTRTIMQIRVGTAVTAPTPDVTLPNLKAAWAKTATKRGVFELTQDPIIIPQAAYNSAYNASFPTSAAAQYMQIADASKTFQPIDETGALRPAVTMPIEMKAMHDEMGGVYDTMFGRMSGMLGLSNPLSPIHVLIPYGLASPPTDVVMGSLEATPIGVMPDGTQLWRIFHNGVDTHTIHTHLFHAQLVNRTGQDGLQLGVDPIDLGWKDTFRVNPLEVTFLALRPTIPLQSQLPFEVPDSLRLIDPALPEAATLIPPPPAGWFDPAGNAIPEILNHYVNFGWEYVWHCHILAHEEMDMMHSLVFTVPPLPPNGLSATLAGTANNPRVNLAWTDASMKEVQYTIDRASDANFTVGLVSFNVANPTSTTTGPMTFQDTTVSPNNVYWYRVSAIGAPVGDAFTAGFPTMSANSLSNTVSITVGAMPGTPTAPTGLTAALQTGPMVSLTWTDNATNETGFSVERCTASPTVACDQDAQYGRIAAPGPRRNTGTVTYLDATIAFGNTYFYRVAALNGAGLSAYSPVPVPPALAAGVSVDVPGLPPVPTSLTVSAVKANGNNYTANLGWGWTAADPASFTIERATNLSFTTALTSVTVAGNTRTLAQTVNRNSTYYFRIRANNAVGGFSAWRNAQPFPIRTGP